MTTIETKITGLVKKLGKKQTITPIQACNKIQVYDKRSVSNALEKLHQQGVLIQRGRGETYSLNPNPRIKPLGYRGKI